MKHSLHWYYWLYTSKLKLLYRRFTHKYWKEALIADIKPIYKRKIPLAIITYILKLPFVDHKSVSEFAVFRGYSIKFYFNFK